MDERCPESDVASVEAGKTSRAKRKEDRREEPSEKEAKGLHSGKQACLRRRKPTRVKMRVRRRKTERGSNVLWDPEEPDGDQTSGWSTCRASQAFCPRETNVRSLRTRKDHVRFAWQCDDERLEVHLHVWVSHELHTGTPVHSPAPISPEQRSGTTTKGMQEHADVPRLCRCIAIPWTRTASAAGTTAVETGRRDHTQAAIGFSAPLLDTTFLSGWTVEGPV